MQTNRENRQFGNLRGEEITVQRGRNTKTLDLGEGRRQTIVYSHAAHFEKGGAWHEIDNPPRAGNRCSGTRRISQPGKWAWHYLCQNGRRRDACAGGICWPEDWLAAGEGV